MTSRIYQNRIKNLLQQKFPNQEISEEWIAFRGMPYQYAPRVDIALGPFNIAPHENKISEYNYLLDNTIIDTFLRGIYRHHVDNIGLEYLNEIIVPYYEDLIMKNQNSRCFIAFEIENSSTKKHIMGSIINAASLGRIGVGVAYNEAVMRTFLRIMNYLAFLKRVDKNTYDTTNFLVVTKQQLEEICQQ